MTRLLIVTTIPCTLEAFLLPFAQYFRTQGWRVDGMAQGISANAECLRTFERIWEVNWSRNPLDPRNLLEAPAMIQKVMQQEKYDIVHVHTPVAAFVTRYALKNWRKQGQVKVIYTAHGFHFHAGGKPLKNAIFLTLEKLAGLWTDYLVVINREDELAAKKHQIVPLDRIRYMPGIGVDLNYYNPQAVSASEIARIYQELGITEKTPLFLSVAEFIPRKHHRDAIQAFAALARPEVHLALPGTGSLLEEMRQLASDLGVKDRVHFLGIRKDIPALMRSAVATILVSEQEGLPRSVLESLAMEIPAIGSNIRGTQDLLQADSGLLVNVGDIEGITKAMTWVLEHPEAAKAMGKRGRKLMGDYDLRQIIKLHEELYAEALFCVNY